MSTSHAIVPTHRLADHAKLAAAHAKLMGAALSLLRSSESYGADDEKHQLAIAEMRQALGLAIDDLAPLLAASVERARVRR